MSSRSQRLVPPYVSALVLGLLALLVGTGMRVEIDPDDLIPWLVFTALLFGTEFQDLYFHDKSGARWGLSASEAILCPMIVSLPAFMVIVGLVVAVGIERIIRRLGMIKTAFNVAQIGISGGVASGVWHLTSNPGAGFDLRNGVAVLLAIVAFSICSHVLTSVVIALVEGTSFFEVSSAVAATTALGLAGAIVVGMFFAASFVAARWTMFLFPVALALLFLANRAMVRQARESERIAYLLEASRAILAGPDLRHALIGFLNQARLVASSAEARVVLHIGGDQVWSGVRNEQVIADLDDTIPASMQELADHLAVIRKPLLVGQDESGPSSKFREDLGVSSFVVVPLVSGEGHSAILLVIDRVGAGEFEADDVRLLEALGNELMVGLDSYRLFAEVAEERERFGRIFSGSKEGICLIDADGCVKAWNPAMTRISGYSADEMMDRVWSEVVTIRDRDEARVQADELVGVETDDELELVTKSGPSRWVTVVSGPVGDVDDGGWVVLIRDVSAEHEIEAAKSDFLSTISHELRTPLTTIKGSLQVLARGRENLPAALSDQMIGVTTRGAERLERLVMNLLVVSQIESGTMPVFPDAVPIEELVRERVDAMLSGHEQKIINGSAQRLVVRADRERLNHAVEHLLENAQKFGGKDGQITIDIERHGASARLSVTDEGPGIPAEDQERIFERFTRLGDVLTRETQGAGVGLFIAARSAQAMGGEIGVESRMGEGSTFHITLPLAQPVAVVDDADTA